MRILGIDPSINHSGWAVIHTEYAEHRDVVRYIKGGVILNTSKKDCLHKRLFFISSYIKNILSLYEIERVAMEKSFVNMNPASSLKLAYVRGAIMSVIGEKGDTVNFYEYAPNYIKKSIVGSGHATKNQILYMMPHLVKNLERTEIFSSDHADALAIAYTCSISEKQVFIQKY